MAAVAEDGGRRVRRAGVGLDGDGEDARFERGRVLPAVEVGRERREGSWS